MEKDCCATELIYGDGKFNADGLDRFVKEVKLAECGVSYGVVAIVGPQSSGKSALQNHLFTTQFANSKRSQTTKGIWIDKCIGIEPCTIAMDLEGTDGRAGGQDDTFKKQSTLFALAVSDIVLINIKGYSNYAPIINGPESQLTRQEMFKRSLDGQDKPFLETFFQVVMRFGIPRKTTLLFVIHDNSKTPFQHWHPGSRKFILNVLLGKALEEIWNGVPKLQAHKSTRFSDFFSEEVVVLSSYEEKEKFKEEVTELRQKLSHSISPGGFAGDRRGLVPASGFSFSAQQIWKVIKENKDLDLPAHKVMVATVRCEEIANQIFNQLIYDKGWLALKEAVQTGPVQGFGKRLSSILGTYLSKYDTEATIYFDEGARNSKRQLLESKALDFVYPAYTNMLGHVSSKALEDFKVRLEQSLNKGRGFATYVRICTHSSMLEFDKGCADAAVIQANWDASRVREKLQRDIDAHASSVCSAKLSELNVNHEQQLSASLTGPVKTLLETGGKDTWASIRKLLNRETEVAISEFSTVVADFELDEATIAEMLQHLRDYSRNVVEKKAREEATKIMTHMKDRFSTVFNYDSDSMLRVWTGKEDIRSITKDARSASMKLLSVMAAIRLDEKPDHIEKVLFSSLMDGAVTVSSSQDGEIEASVHPLASSNWEEVSSKSTLITPVQCQSLWTQFIAETENSVTQAISAHVVAATARCEEIANQKFSQLIFDEDWLALEEAVQIGPVQGFGKRLSSILSTYLFKYDTEATIYFDEGARNSKRQLLESKALDFVYPAYTNMLGHVSSKALEDFKVRLEQSLNKGRGFATYVRICTHSSMLEFDKGCADAAVIQANWDASRVREKLQRDIDAHASSVCSAKLSELNVNHEQQLSASLTGPVKTLLETGGKDTWASIRKLLNRETEVAISEFSTVVADFELDEATIAEMLQHLRDYSRNVVEKKAREEATKIMIHMKDRFSTVFNYDSDSMLRVWTGKEDIRSITKDARSASMKLLSVMAAIRLDEKPDHIEKVLFSSLMDGAVTVSSSQDGEIEASVHPLASSNWEEVSSKSTLITPVQCQSLWTQFIAETENSVTQAISAHVVAATARCEEIANQKFSQLIFDEDWLALEEAVQIGPVQGFGKRLSSILSTYLFKYDTEATIYFDEGARNSKRQLLESKALDFVYPAYTNMLGHVSSKALEDFKVRLEQSLNKGRGFATYVRICTHSSMLEFDKGCADAAVIQANWDASRVREKLQRDIDAHASSVCSAKLSELNVNHEQQLSASLTGPVKTLLETGGKDTWASIRKLLNRETEVAISEFSTVVADFELDEATIAEMLQHLRDYSRNVVEKKAREEATKIMIHMKDRFSTVFNYDSDSMLRVWTGKEDIRSITKDARSASMKLLSVMAAIRLDEKPDHIEKVLFSSLMDGAVTVSSSQDGEIEASVHPLASSNWEEVSSKSTLITPVQCQSLWTQFIAETENSVTQAISAHVVAATARCEEIANQKFSQLIFDEDWLALEEAVQIGPVQGFGKRLSSILSTYLFKYDTEATIYFDEGARNSKRQLLESKALDFVYPAYTTMLGHVHSKALEDFKVRLEQSLNKGEGFTLSVRTCTQSSMLEFDKGCADAAIQQANWDASRVREKLQHDIDAHASSICSAKLSELNFNYERQLSASLTGPVEALLETGGKDTWASIRKLLNRETEVAISNFSTAISDFELEKETIAKMLRHLRDYSRNVVEKVAREEATKIMIHMKDRFFRVFNCDSGSMPRVWTEKEDIRSVTKDARSAALHLLSIMAAIRLDERPDNIEKVLFSSLMDETVTVSSSQDRRIGASAYPLASSTWEEVSSKDTLITPVQCKSLWEEFKTETEFSVIEAILAQEAYKQSNNWLPPPWATMAIVVHGFNQFMHLSK